MLFDIEIQDNSKTVTLSGSGGTWTLGFDDLNKHSAAWLLNQISMRGDAEIL